jgi:hypothetical protein
MTCGHEWCVNAAHMKHVTTRQEFCRFGHPMSKAYRTTRSNGSPGRTCRTCHTVLVVCRRLKGRRDVHARRMRAYWKARRLDPKPLPKRFRVFTRYGKFNGRAALSRPGAGKEVR